MNEYQEQKEAEVAKHTESTFATVGEVFADGITLIFDGQTAASEKHYKCNAFEVFAAGERVKIAKDSGTYVVEYPVGNPRSSFSVDNAVNADKLNYKTESELVVFKSSKIIDQDSSSRSIDFKTDWNGNFYIRNSTFETWKKITVT